MTDNGSRNPVTFVTPVAFTGIDPDAQSYFERAGVTNPEAMDQLNEFIIGSKQGGYWTSMEAWLLRASQNAGTGTTAYALKSDSNNGTLVNTPIWGSDGILFASTSSQKITTEFTPTGGEVTVLGTHKPTAGSSVLGVASQDNINGGRRWELNYLGNTDQGNWTVFNPGFGGPSISSAEGLFRSLIGRCGASVCAVHDFVNTEVTSAAGAVAGSSVALWIGARQNIPDDFFYNGTIAHVLYFSIVLSEAQKSHLHQLIQTTIGSGLN